MQPKAPYAIEIQDPQFSHDDGVWINGYLFLPALGELGLVTAAAMTECQRLRKRVDELLTSNTATVLENRELRRAALGVENGDNGMIASDEASAESESDLPRRRAAA